MPGSWFCPACEGYGELCDAVCAWCEGKGRVTEEELDLFNLELHETPKRPADFVDVIAGGLIMLAGVTWLPLYLLFAGGRP